MRITDKQLEALTKHNNKKSVGVYQFCYKTGKYIDEHISLREAERATGVANNNICLACRGAKRQAGGFIWVRKEDYDS